MIRVIHRRMLGFVLLVALGLLLGACYGPAYLPYEGREIIRKGEGGAKETFQGIDFWWHGRPPRTYRMLGIIKDARPANRWQMSGLKPDVSTKAKEAGGDAIIVLDEYVEIPGRHVGKYAVIQYLDEECLIDEPGCH